jgi:acyl-CoA thioesterase FadM
MRIKLTFPQQVHFTTELDIRIGDINYGNHLSNDAVLRLAHEVRLRMLRAHHLSELDMGGCSLIMSDAAVVYKSEGFYGELLRAELSVVDFTTSGFNIYYRFLHDDGRELAIVKTGMVCFDYSSRKVRQVPDSFARLFPQ